jgi:hypothetical protein
MKPLYCAVLICLQLTFSVYADDSAVAKQLEALGAKVIIKEGVVSQVDFKDCSKLGEAEFKLIGQLPRLKNLTLYNKCNALNDATVGPLTELKELESLGTDGAQFSDEGLKQLAKLKNLKSASFFHTSFGVKTFKGTGFGYLKDCPKLERLTVAGISMSDEGFAAIATITQLRDFSTWHTYQTEAGNAELAKLPNLKTLKLGQRLPRGGMKLAPSLSDVSIPTLAKMQALETLRISEGRFTVEALKALKALPKLKVLNIAESELTAGSIEELRKELPNAKVDLEPLTEDQKKKLEMYLK